MTLNNSMYLLFILIFLCRYTPRHSATATEEKLTELSEKLARFGLTDSSLYKTITADTSLPMEIVVPPPTAPIFDMFQTKEFLSPLASGFDLGSLSDPLKQFYEMNVSIPVSEPDRYVDIFQRTLTQADSGDWHMERGHRISSSQAKNIHTARNPTTCLNHFKKKIIKHPNLDYGIENEDNARAKYSEVTGYSVEKCGLIVSQNYNWLCGSPDGVVLNAAGERILLEIKCPKSCEGAKIIVPWVKDSQLRQQVKQGADYYCQVQILMFLCRVKKCHFFIWSEEDYLLLEIEFNESFL